MRRLFLALAVVVTVSLAAVTGALAVNAHFKHGSPTFNDLGSQLRMTGTFAGLGSFNTQLNISATGNATAECVNPGSGEHRPAGQQPAPATFPGSTSIPKNEIKNGNVTINVTTDPPVSPIPGAPGCPNSSWTENITSVAFTGVSFALIQDANNDGAYSEAPSISGTCSFAPATSDGAVPSASVTC